VKCASVFLAHKKRHAKSAQFNMQFESDFEAGFRFEKAFYLSWGETCSHEKSA
jgi:hypothetical protein